MLKQQQQELALRTEIAIKLVVNPNQVTDADRQFLLREGDKIVVMLRQAASQVEICARQAEQESKSTTVMPEVANQKAGVV